MTATDDPSGAATAAAAHAAGAVVLPVVTPTQSVWLEFRVHGTGEQARELADAVAVQLADHPQVLPPVTVAVTEGVAA